MKMRLVNRLEQGTLYPMVFLWIAAFIVGFYDAYLYLENNCNYPAPVFVNSQTDKANQLW